MDASLLIAIFIFAGVTALLVRPALRRAYSNYNRRREKNSKYFREIEKINALPEREAEELARALMQNLGTGDPAPERWRPMGLDSGLLNEFFSRYSLLAMEEGDETLSALLLRRIIVETEPFVIIGAEESYEFSYGIREKDGAVFSLRVDDEHDVFDGLQQEDVDFCADSVAKFLLQQSYMFSVVVGS